MFQMMGVFAEFVRAMIQERVRAGPTTILGLADCYIDRQKKSAKLLTQKSDWADCNRNFQMRTHSSE